MIPFLFSVDNLPFTMAICVMLVISFLEGIGMIIGISFFGIFEVLFPLHGNEDKQQGPASGSLVGNLRVLAQVGKMPAILVIVVFLTVFGLAGLSIQFILKSLLGHCFPWFMVICPILVIALTFTFILAMILLKIPFRDLESSFAVPEDTFVGKVAIITLGMAKKGEPAEARLLDPYGKNHFVMVEPDREGDQFDQFMHVLLVKKEGSVFKAIKNPNRALVNEKIDK